MDATTTVKEQRSSTGALGKLYLRHSGSAKSLAYLLTGSRATAEDLVQDAFVRMTGRFAHIRPADAFGAYLRRTIINLYLSRLRRFRLEKEALERERTVAPSEQLPDVEQRDELLSALRLLPDRQRAAVVLRYCMDLSEAQVAEAMGCSLAAARNLIGRGIRSLRARKWEGNYE
jgi:RNA polymerase sigma-70 factor (sigma-E family)